LASPFSPPCFAQDEVALDAVLRGIKLTVCPHCHRPGALIGHGLLRGYAERSSERVVRGRRFFCSDRGKRSGCGRTFSVKLSTVLCSFVVRTLTLWCFLQAVLSGRTRRAAWICATDGALSLSSGYRLWRRLCGAQSALRTRLCREAAAPPSNDRAPWAQLREHLRIVVGAGGTDLLSAFQIGLQRGVFER
jgi:hypothetical protein